MCLEDKKQIIEYLTFGRFGPKQSEDTSGFRSSISKNEAPVVREALFLLGN